MAFPNQILAGSTLLTPAIQSPDYVEHQTGWRIDASGTVEFNGAATINGDLDVGGDMYITQWQNGASVRVYSVQQEFNNEIYMFPRNAFLLSAMTTTASEVVIPGFADSWFTWGTDATYTNLHFTLSLDLEPTGAGANYVLGVLYISFDSDAGPWIRQRGYVVGKLAAGNRITVMNQWDVFINPADKTGIWYEFRIVHAGTVPYTVARDHTKYSMTPSRG